MSDAKTTLNHVPTGVAHLRESVSKLCADSIANTDVCDVITSLHLCPLKYLEPLNKTRIDVDDFDERFEDETYSLNSKEGPKEKSIPPFDVLLPPSFEHGVDEYLVPDFRMGQAMALEWKVVRSTPARNPTQPNPTRTVRASTTD
jgi:hypothetical protein